MNIEKNIKSINETKRKREHQGTRDNRKSQASSGQVGGVESLAFNGQWSIINDSEILHSHKAQLQAELEQYKEVLPEPEFLFKEVNKRHQMTQRELDNMAIENEKEIQNN